MDKISKKKGKVLVIRFSSIGDIVLTSPVVRALHLQKNVEVHFLCKKQYHSLVAHNPHIHQIHTLEASMSELTSKLAAIDFDYIVDLHKNIRSKRVGRAIGKPVYTFDKINWEKWLMVNFGIDKLPKLHLVDRYFAGLTKLGIQNDGEGLDFFFPEKFKPKTNLNLASGKKYYSLALGAAHATKQVPESLIEAIIQKTEQPIHLIGGAAESELGKRLEQKFPNQVTNYAGKSSLHDSAWIIKNSAVLITPDTGMMHIAAALKIPTVLIWGNTIPSLGMYAYYGRRSGLSKNIQVENLKCRPCSKIGKTKCPKGHFKCMLEINPDEVISAIASLSS